MSIRLRWKGSVSSERRSRGSRAVPVALVGALAALVIGCGDSPDRHEAAVAAHPIGARLEAQRDLDDAVAAFRRGDDAAAAARLRAAAGFFRGHPDLARSSARGAFGAVALDLERIGAEIAAGRLRDTMLLGRTLAQAQLAEAEHHRGLAAVAWTRGQAAASGEELVMAVDHLERALSDARLTRSPAAAPVVRRSRSLALALLREAPPPDAADALASLAGEIRRLDASTRAGGG